MTFRTVASIAFFLALCSVGIYWFLNRPTPEESALTNFFSEFKKGKYTEAELQTVGSDFWEMASETSVRDTTGAEYLIGDYFPESRKELLKISIETYVKAHIAKWDYLNMDTQRLSESESVVHFRLAIGIRDFSGGNLIGEVNEGRVEGTAFMQLTDDGWKIKRFELALFSDEGLVLAPYLEQAN
jgi:hypothetical protein